MNSLTLSKIIQKIPTLKRRFGGVFAADTFTRLRPNTFQIVNASKANHPGSHWVLICHRKGQVVFADPLGFNLNTRYKIIAQRLAKLYPKQTICQAVKPPGIQPIQSDACALYCLYLVHIIFTPNTKSSCFSYPNKIPLIYESTLKRLYYYNVY